MTGSVANAIAYADSQLGKPYLWGGESETNGFDCSGLVQSAYGTAGLGLPRTAAAQYAATSAQQVPVGQKLVVGDLVFFSKGAADAIHHVGIYVGNGLVLNAPHTGAKVRIQPLSGFPDFYAATRPLADGNTVQPATAVKGGFKLPGSGALSSAGGFLKTLGGGLVGFVEDPVGTEKTGLGIAAEGAKGAAKDAVNSVVSSATSAALAGAGRYVVEGVLVAGGVGLVGVGIYKGVKGQ